MIPEINRVLPPETAEGWYVLHQLYQIDLDRAELLDEAAHPMFDILPEHSQPADNDSPGWSAAIRVVGATASVMFMHFRRTLDEIGAVQRELEQEPWMRALIPVYSFLSVTEAGLYYMTSKLVKETEARGGKVGDEQYLASAHEKIGAELANPHTRRRLYPPRPETMPYVCFYPMSKRRSPGQNWYTLSLDERNRLMYEHGMSGRRFAGRIQQVISGAMGFDTWEWGVTLFAADPLEFKRIVTEMRFDEASAQYAEFGDFFVGKMGTLEETLVGP